MVRPSDFSYKRRAERTISSVLTPLSDSVDGGVIGALRVALYLRNTERLKKALRVLESLESVPKNEPTVPQQYDPFQTHFETLLYGDQELKFVLWKSFCVPTIATFFRD